MSAQQSGWVWVEKQTKSSEGVIFWDNFFLELSLGTFSVDHRATALRHGPHVVAMVSWGILSYTLRNAFINPSMVVGLCAAMPEISRDQMFSIGFRLGDLGGHSVLSQNEMCFSRKKS